MGAPAGLWAGWAFLLRLQEAGVARLLSPIPSTQLFAHAPFGIWTDVVVFSVRVIRMEVYGDACLYTAKEEAHTNTLCTH